MKKSKKTIIFTLVFSVLSVVLLGCCLSRMSYAASPGVQDEKIKDCHSDSAKMADSADSKCCACEKTTAILDVKGFSFLKTKLSLAQFGKILFLQRAFFDNTVEKEGLFTENPPPLVSAKEIPFYLEYSVFRI